MDSRGQVVLQFEKPGETDDYDSRSDSSFRSAKKRGSTTSSNSSSSSDSSSSPPPPPPPLRTKPPLSASLSNNYGIADFHYNDGGKQYSSSSSSSSEEDDVPPPEPTSEPPPLTPVTPIVKDEVLIPHNNNDKPWVAPRLSNPTRERSPSVASIISSSSSSSSQNDVDEVVEVTPRVPVLPPRVEITDYSAPVFIDTQPRLSRASSMSSSERDDVEEVHSLPPSPVLQIKPIEPPPAPDMRKRVSLSSLSSSEEEPAAASPFVPPPPVQEQPKAVKIESPKFSFEHTKPVVVHPEIIQRRPKERFPGESDTSYSDSGTEEEAEHVRGPQQPPPPPIVVPIRYSSDSSSSSSSDDGSPRTNFAKPVVPIVPVGDHFGGANNIRKPRAPEAPLGQPQRNTVESTPSHEGAVSTKRNTYTSSEEDDEPPHTGGFNGVKWRNQPLDNSNWGNPDKEAGVYPIVPVHDRQPQEQQRHWQPSEKMQRSAESTKRDPSHTPSGKIWTPRRDSNFSSSTNSSSGTDEVFVQAKNNMVGSNANGRENEQRGQGEGGGLVYSWKDISVRVGPDNVENMDVEKGKGCFGKQKKQSKTILKDVTGIVYPGQLVAIMGASGAGKTTLLNVLTFRNTRNLKISGDRYVNGVPVTSTNMLSAISAYVQQDDIFIGTLTVKEQLIFQARLRMDSNVSFKERLARVDEVLRELNLNKCADTLIGVPGRIKGISGGEKKRLSFACEVLTNPGLMFCDEPTSGLDSYMARSVVSVLKDMARKGKTIVCTIHQPSSEVYTMFDRLLLMAEGRTAYLGEAHQAIPFFKELGHQCPPHFNPADFFIQTLAIEPNDVENGNKCKKQVQDICSVYDNSIGAEIRNAVDRVNNTSMDQSILNRVKPNKSPYKASWLQQFFAVFGRCWKTQFTDPMVVSIRAISTLFVGLIVGIIYLNQDYTQEGIMNINGAMFLLLTNLTFQNVFGVVNVFAAELPVFLREHFNGMYRTDVYYLAKTLSELPTYVILPFLFGTVVYWMVGLNSAADRYLIFCAIVVLIANIACSFGYMISCVSSSLNVALAMGPVLIIPFLLFGGFFLNAGSVPVYLVWIKYISWFYYGNEALSINQWHGVDYIECNRNISCVTTGDELLETLNFNEDNLILDVCMLLVLLIAFRLIAFGGLLFKTYRRQ